MAYLNQQWDTGIKYEALPKLTTKKLCQQQWCHFGFLIVK